MHGPVIQTKQSTILEGSGVLEAIWHSQRFAVKFCSKEEMLKKKSLGSLYNHWEEKVRFFRGQPSWTLGNGVSETALEGTWKD